MTTTTTNGGDPPALTANQEALLHALADGPLTVKELKAKTDLSETAIRENLSRLGHPAGSRSVKSSKDGKWSLNKKGVAVAAEGGRGRKPGARRDEVVARDEQVFDIIKRAGDNGASRDVIAGEVGVDPGIAYISIWRLKKEGRVQKKRVSGSRSTFWVVS